MKICKTCNIPKLEKEFRKNIKKIDGLDVNCKVCVREKDKINYYKNLEISRKKAATSKKEIRYKKRQVILEYLKKCFCIDCGENNPIVLEFDHIKNKTFNVSYLIHKDVSLNKIFAEIDKCEVRCANCHRIKTAKDFNYYRLKGDEILADIPDCLSGGEQEID